jgi:hypothetical protein
MSLERPRDGIGVLRPSRWKGVSTFHAVLSQSGYDLPTALAKITLGGDVDAEKVSALLAFWSSRGDAVLSHARAPTTAQANEAFTKAVERYGLSPQARVPPMPEGLEESANYQMQRSLLYDFAEAEAVARHIKATDLIRKSHVKAMLLEEYAEYGLSKIKKPDFITHPAIALGLYWGGGLISLAFDLGGRAELAGQLPFEFWITYADGSVALLGDCRYLLPGISEYFVSVRGGFSRDGVLIVERSTLLATYAVRVALDLPRLLAQTF